MTYTLGIESSCDETAASIVQSPWKVRSSIIASQVDVHAEYGGVVPEIASRQHTERILPILKQCMTEAGISENEISGVAVGHRPGLIGCLLVGTSAAKALAWSLGVPIVGVDHVHAHVLSGLLDTDTPADARKDLYPALGLVVSGGHTAMYVCTSACELRRIGTTIDDALGEAYDKAATMLGLRYPGGPNLDTLARSPNADSSRYSFPVSRLDTDSLDFSFSGLKTAMLYAIRGTPMRDGTFPRTIDDLTDQVKIDLACAFQDAAVKAVILKLQRAHDYLRSTGVPIRALFVGGGVSANSLLRTELNRWAERNTLELVIPTMRYCVDNAAMIAGLGGEFLHAGRTDDLSLRAHPQSAH